MSPTDLRVFSGVIQEGAPFEIPEGSEIQVQPIHLQCDGEESVPKGVSNWEAVSGALLAVVVGNSKGRAIVGTAVSVAPGVLVTAKHVLVDHIKSCERNETWIQCISPNSSGLDIWRVSGCSYAESDDIALLSVELMSAPMESWMIRTIPITTRTPVSLEKVRLMGFRFDVELPLDQKALIDGSLYVSSGEVGDVFHPKRDSVFMPFPSFEIRCGALGGMSGGAVLDKSGFLLGIVSSSMESEGLKGPAFAARILSALNRNFEPSWPPGLLPTPTTLLKIDPRLCVIQRHDCVRVRTDGSMDCEVWFD